MALEISNVVRMFIKIDDTETDFSCNVYPTEIPADAIFENFYTISVERPGGTQHFSISAGLLKATMQLIYSKRAMLETMNSDDYIRSSRDKIEDGKYTQNIQLKMRPIREFEMYVQSNDHSELLTISNHSGDNGMMNIRLTFDADWIIFSPEQIITLAERVNRFFARHD